MTRRNLRFTPAHRIIVVVGAFCLGCLPAAWCQVGLGQSGGELAPDQCAAMTPQRRGELYRQLRQRAELLEAQTAVVKLAAKLAGPTVVHIDARDSQDVRLQVGALQRFGEAGAGVIVRWKGKCYVLTSAHVIHGIEPDHIKLSMADGRRLHADRVWEDVESDVAVIAIAAGNDISDAPLGDSDTLEIGDYVLAVGSPFGLSHTVTSGIISAKGRWNLDLAGWGVRYQDFLQTDAAINPGNSGGPLLNLRGEVIAINTAFVTNSGGNEGIGFAIPINMYMRIAAQLIERGKVQRARIGVAIDTEFTPSKAARLGLPRVAGALISGVTPGSPAAAARLRPGDVILQYDRTPVENDAHLVNLIGVSEVGKAVALQVFRDTKLVQARLVVSDQDHWVMQTALRDDPR
jgi:serine protease Do